MSETLHAYLPLLRWQGERGTYHLVTFIGEIADSLTKHAMLHKLEFGRKRGFGSVKLTARIGDTQWRTSVFPQKQSSEWMLLISRKVMRAEGLDPGQPVDVTLLL